MKTTILFSAFTLVASAQSIHSEIANHQGGEIEVSNSSYGIDKISYGHERGIAILAPPLSENLSFRRATDGDLKALVSIMENQESQKLTRLLAPPDAPDLLSEFMHQNPEAPSQKFIQVAEDIRTHKVFAFACGEFSEPSPGQKTVQMNFYTSPKVWQSGEARVAIEGLLQSVSKSSGMSRVQFAISPENLVQQGHLVTLGFERGGQLHPSRFLHSRDLGSGKELFVRYERAVKPEAPLDLKIGVQASAREVVGFNHVLKTSEQ